MSSSLAPAHLRIEGEDVQRQTARMQPGNWNDLRYLLAIKRGQTLTAAGRQLRVDDTTVSRRLSALQAALGARLVQRKGDKKLVLTQAGEVVARRAEAMELQFQLLGEVAGADQDPCLGTVRVTSVPILINRLFAGAARDLLGNHASLVIELIPDSRDYSLTRREADIAVRLARPTAGGMAVKARRIGTLRYAAFARIRRVTRTPAATVDHFRRRNVPPAAGKVDREGDQRR
jgi:DNA-binding transcriptional LysR family regulator